MTENLYKCDDCGCITKAVNAIEANEKLSKFRPVCVEGIKTNHHVKWYRNTISRVRGIRT